MKTDSQVHADNTRCTTQQTQACGLPGGFRAPIASRAWTTWTRKRVPQVAHTTASPHPLEIPSRNRARKGTEPDPARQQTHEREQFRRAVQRSQAASTTHVRSRGITDAGNQQKQATASRKTPSGSNHAGEGAPNQHRGAVHWRAACASRRTDVRQQLTSEPLRSQQRHQAQALSRPG